mgnify:CR=1 FL=1
MNREYHHWYSKRLARDMEFLVFGHAGAKVLMFPTRDGRFYEYENLGIINVLRDKINAGHLQLFCIDSLDHETFYSRWRQPKDKIKRHILFEDYVLHEMLPFMQAKNPHPCTIAHGCSLGAYHAANLVFRHPEHFQKLVAFSGRYDLTLSVEFFHDLFSGYYDDNIYFNTPSHFLPNLDEKQPLERLKNMDITLVIGKHDPFLQNNRELSDVLKRKGIDHQYVEWDGRAHQGQYWRQMARLYI